jgi:hypothetical protein
MSQQKAQEHILASNSYKNNNSPPTTTANDIFDPPHNTTIQPREKISENERN